MNRVSAITLILTAWVLAAPATALAAADKAASQPAASPAASADMADGEIRKIDKEAGKITLKHGVIKSLDMPGMTMVFQVKDKALLDQVKTGDKVKFSAVSDNGKLVVTDIQPAK